MTKLINLQISPNYPRPNDSQLGLSLSLRPPYHAHILMQPANPPRSLSLSLRRPRYSHRRRLLSTIIFKPVRRRPPPLPPPLSLPLSSARPLFRHFKTLSILPPRRRREAGQRLRECRFCHLRNRRSRTSPDLLTPSLRRALPACRSGSLRSSLSLSLSPFRRTRRRPRPSRGDSFLPF